VELFNQEVWDTPGELTLRRMIECHLAHVALP
jgi:hypothetical protein